MGVFQVVWWLTGKVHLTFSLWEQAAGGVYMGELKIFLMWSLWDALCVNTGLLIALHSLLTVFCSSACKTRWPGPESIGWSSVRAWKGEKTLRESWFAIANVLVAVFQKANLWHPFAAPDLLWLLLGSPVRSPSPYGSHKLLQASIHLVSSLMLCQTSACLLYPLGSVLSVPVAEIKALKGSRDIPGFYAGFQLNLRLFFFKYMNHMGKATFQKLGWCFSSVGEFDILFRLTYQICALSEAAFVCHLWTWLTLTFPLGCNSVKLQQWVGLKSDSTSYTTHLSDKTFRSVESN